VKENSRRAKAGKERKKSVSAQRKERIPAAATAPPSRCHRRLQPPLTTTIVLPHSK